MKNFIRTGILALALGYPLQAQLNVSIVTKTPMPASVSAWEQDPTALILIVTNSTTASYSARVTFTVRDLEKDQVVVSSLNTHPDIPKFDIGAMQSVTLFGKAVVNANTVVVDPSIKSTAAATNKISEGTYELCVQILASGRVGGEIGAQCQTFTIVIPDPPTLINPENSAVLQPPAIPVFTWTPVFITAGVPASYNLVVAPIFKGQTAKDAILKNPPLLKKIVLATSYFYEPSNPSFSLYPNAIGFAWQVQAVSFSPDEGFTESHGESEIFVFTVGSSVEPPTLMAPADNAIASTKSPEFTWSYVFQANENIRFRLRVAEVISGQTPDVAIDNYPVHSQIIYGQITKYKPSQPLSLSGTKQYVWQVQVLNAITGTVLRSSTVRSFTITPLQLLVPYENATVSMKRPAFSWSYQGKTGLFYDIRVAAVPMIMTPDFSLENLLQKGPFVYQMNNIDGAKVSMTNTPGLEMPKHTPNSDIQLSIGLKYAWRIIARQSAGGAVIGTSDARVFGYNPYQAGIPFNTQVSGKLLYHYPAPGDNQVSPLGNANIKLTVKYVLKNVSLSVGYASGVKKGTTYIIPPATSLQAPGFQNNPKDMNKVLSVTKTNAEGEFTFSFISLDSMKLIAKNYEVNYGGGEFEGTVRGDLYRVARITVEAPHSAYYTSPDVDIVVQPGETLAPGFFGLIAANVRSYALKVQVKTFENITQATVGSLANMKVFLLREKRPAYAPVNEGAEPKRGAADKPETMKMYWGAVCEIIGMAETKADGIARFTRLVKNIGPNDKYILYAESMTGSFYNYKGWLGGVSFGNPDDHASFNNEYPYKEISRDLQCFPLPPRVYGTVRRGDSKEALLWAQVTLTETMLIATKETQQLTNYQGKFDFTNLPVIQDANKNVTGPIRLLKVRRYGYRDTTLKVNNLVPMRPGDQWGREIEMKPYSVIKGKLVDESGNGVAAYITLQGGATKKVTPPPYFVFGTWKTPPASFEIPAPQGSQKLIIDPTFFNSSYLRDTVAVYVDSPTEELPSPIVVYRKAHRLRVVVQEASTSKLKLPGFAPKMLSGALVRVEDKYGNAIQGPQGPLQATTNQNGVAELVFSNSGNEFVLAVGGPKEQDYVARKFPVPYSVPSKYWTTLTAGLLKGAKISGFVYVGDNQPVPNAHIYLAEGATQVPVETWSDNTGSFVLRNVPIGTNEYKAAKSKSNMVGDQQSHTVTEGGISGVTFKLRVYQDMDISQLMGFPIEVDALSETGGSVRISGTFTNLDSLGNKLFQVPTSSSPLKFVDIEIVPSSAKTMLFGNEVPIAKPKDAVVKTEENTLPVKVYSSFAGVIQDQNIGVEVVESQGGLGVVKGKVHVGQTEFQKDVSFDDGGFYIADPNSSDLRIPVITASKNDPFPAPGGLRVVNAAGGSVRYSLFDFDATADSSKSFLRGDSLRLRTTLHTNLANLTPADLAIAMGDLLIGKNGVYTTLSNVMKTTSFNLDQWSVKCDTLSLTGYLQLKGGTLKTSAIDIPIISMVITPTSILASEFNLKSMSIGGIIPLEIHTQPVLGYDKAYKRWFLSASGSPSASFSGLPGMATGSKFQLSSFSMYSTESSMSLVPMLPQPSIKVYEIGILTPDLISYFPSTGIVDIKGLSFSFPKVSVNATMRYTKENNQVKFKLVPFQFSFDAKGVHFASGFTADEGASQVLDANGFRAKGKMSEEGKFSLVSWLYHTDDSTSIWVETPNSPFLSSPAPWQTMAVKSNAMYLDKITGSTNPLGGQDWDNFWFAGDLTGSKADGIKAGQNRLTFVVKGEVVANGQQLGIKNVDTPFGNMTWTYDFEQGRLWGNLHIEKQIAGKISLSGDANNIVDGDGWYLLGGITMSMASPSYSGQAGVLFGNYPMTNEIKTKFQDHSWVYKNKGVLPPTFPKSVSGFFFEGSVEVPIPIFPDFDFDFGLVTAKLTKSVGADVRFKTEFGETNTYGAGVDVFAKIEVGVGGTIGVACATVSAELFADLKFEGQYESSGAWYLEGEQLITLSGSTKIGFGGCDADCDPIDLGPLSTPCETSSEGASKSISVLCHYGSDGKYMHFKFK